MPISDSSSTTKTRSPCSARFARGLGMARSGDLVGAKQEVQALQELRTIKFHYPDNEALLAYSKFDPVSGDQVLVVVTLNGTPVTNNTPNNCAGTPIAGCSG